VTSTTRRGWQPGDGLVCVHAKKAPPEMPCGKPVTTEVCQTNAVGRNSYPVTKALCAQHAGIDPAPSQVMGLARKAAMERLCAEHWEAYCGYLNEAIAEISERLRSHSGAAS
jgi:hypothetical protein